jgi:hypothetical protein
MHDPRVYKVTDLELVPDGERFVLHLTTEAGLFDDGSRFHFSLPDWMAANLARLINGSSPDPGDLPRKPGGARTTPVYGAANRARSARQSF